MSARTKRVQLTAGIVGALTATIALSASPASASGTYTGLAYVYGADTYVGDWGNEGLLSTSTNTASNATCLWQKILWADGYLDSSSDIDGVFGSGTKAATVELQRFYNLGDDGSVGQQTFGWADNYLSYVSGSTADGSSLTLKYDGAVRDITITRNTSGNYGFYDGDGNARSAGYDYRTCS